MSRRIGTCSECGGPVTMPEMMINPIAHCERCGAHAKNPHGPVIQMDRGVPRDFTTYGASCTCHTTDANCPLHSFAPPVIRS